MGRNNKHIPADWTIHLDANVICYDDAGEDKIIFPAHICNAHTHGMSQYGHMDFQMVILAPAQVIAYVLNTLCSRVRNGEFFNPGDTVDDIFLDFPVRLDLFTESNRSVLRVIIPDRQGRLPESQYCEYPHSFQLFTQDTLDDLIRNAEIQLA